MRDRGLRLPVELCFLFGSLKTEQRDVEAGVPAPCGGPCGRGGRGDRINSR